MGTPKIHLCIIDPQNSFMDNENDSDFTAELPVPGASDDMKRLSKFINKNGKKLHDITVTLDSHTPNQIFHSTMFIDSNNNHPSPFTLINHDDLKNKIWAPRNPSFLDDFLYYTEQLEKNGLYRLMIWPQHCIIATKGFCIQKDIHKSLLKWEEEEFSTFNRLTKGTAYNREHYGALKAEVESNDTSTHLNINFLKTLSESDIILLAGEAFSHCVKRTLDQIVENIGDKHIKKIVVLTDATSCIPKTGDIDFPEITKNWFKNMKSLGVQEATTQNFF